MGRNHVPAPFAYGDQAPRGGPVARWKAFLFLASPDIRDFEPRQRLRRQMADVV